MFKVEVGQEPLMFMPYARIIKETTNEEKVEELKDVFYAILYDFGTPIGCGRMKVNKVNFFIDNIKIIDKFNSEELRSDIYKQFLKKATLLGLEEKISWKKL